MQTFTMEPPIFAAAILLPAIVFAAMAAMLSDAPAEWGEGALLAWSAVVIAATSGAAITMQVSILSCVSIVLSFLALMIGGPPGSAAACVAAIVLVVSGEALICPRWVAVALAVLLGLVVARSLATLI